MIGFREVLVVAVSTCALVATDVRGQNLEADSEPTLELDAPSGITPEIERRDELEDASTLPSIFPPWYLGYREWRDGLKETLRLEGTASIDTVAQGYASGERAFGAVSGDLTVSGRVRLFGRVGNSDRADKAPSFLGFRFRDRRALFGVEPPSQIRPRAGLLWGTVDGFTDAGFQVPDLYLNQELFDNRLLLRFGQLGLDSMFDGHGLASGKRFFMNQAFVAHPGVAFPSFGAGVIARWKSSHKWDLTIGGSNVQGTSQNDEVDFKINSEALFQALQLGIDLDGPRGGLGRIQLTGWHSDELPGEEIEGGEGVSITLEQPKLPGDAKAFFRASYGHGKATRVDRFYAVGYGRPVDGFDYCGVGVSAGRSSADNGIWQGAFEVFYRWQAAQEFHITPDIQIIAGDSLDGRDSFRVVFGLRGGLTF